MVVSSMTHNLNGTCIERSLCWFGSAVGRKEACEVMESTLVEYPLFANAAVHFVARYGLTMRCTSPLPQPALRCRVRRSASSVGELEH